METKNLIALLCLGVAVYFGFNMLQDYQTNQEYPSAVEVGGFSLASIGAILTGAFTLLKKYFPGGTSNKYVQIFELVMELLEEQETWAVIKKQFATAGFPKYIYIKFSWGKGQSYPIEIGKDPDAPPTIPPEGTKTVLVDASGKVVSA